MVIAVAVLLALPPAIALAGGFVATLYSRPDLWRNRGKWALLWETAPRLVPGLRRPPDNGLRPWTEAGPTHEGRFLSMRTLPRSTTALTGGRRGPGEFMAAPLLEAQASRPSRIGRVRRRS